MVENFTPRVIESSASAGTDARLNPGVMVRMPAFGLDGPWRDRGGFAQTMEQLTGMAWLTGLPDGLPRRPARRLRSARGRACRVRAIKSCTRIH